MSTAAAVVIVQPRISTPDHDLDPFAIACPTFGCRGDCFVCDPERKSKDALTVIRETLDMGSGEVVEDGCPIWSSCQQKRARFTQKPFWMRVFGLTAITTGLLALQSFGRILLEKVII